MKLAESGFNPAETRSVTGQWAKGSGSPSATQARAKKRKHKKKAKAKPLTFEQAWGLVHSYNTMAKAVGDKIIAPLASNDPTLAAFAALRTKIAQRAFGTQHISRTQLNQWLTGVSTQRLQSILGPNLQIHNPQDPMVQQHIRDAAQMPESLLGTLKAADKILILGTGGVAQYDPELASKGAPRDHPGQTWGDVTGVYDSPRIVVGTGPDVAEAAAHEMGHAISDIKGWDTNPQVTAAQARLYSKLDPYFQQGGPGGFAGVQEFVAQSIAQYVLYGAGYITRTYDAAWSTWLAQNVGPL